MLFNFFVYEFQNLLGGFAEACLAVGVLEELVKSILRGISIVVKLTVDLWDRDFGCSRWFYVRFWLNK